MKPSCSLTPPTSRRDIRDFSSRKFKETQYRIPVRGLIQSGPAPCRSSCYRIPVSGLILTPTYHDRQVRHRIPVRRVDPPTTRWMYPMSSIESLCAGLIQTPSSRSSSTSYRIPVRRARCSRNAFREHGLISTVRSRFDEFDVFDRWKASQAGEVHVGPQVIPAAERYPSAKAA